MGGDTYLLLKKILKFAGKEQQSRSWEQILQAFGN